MSELTLFIIRHGEKPDEKWPGPGFTDEGREDSESLVIRGWQRAGAWAALFGAGLGGTDYLPPSAIYAAEPGPPDHLNKPPSRRPMETIAPLASRLRLNPIRAYAKGQEADLVAELLGLSGVVLVSWEHRAIITDIIPRLPVSRGTPPSDWPGHRFDVVLRFDRPKGADKFAYHPLYPQLLAGDSQEPLNS